MRREKRRQVRCPTGPKRALDRAPGRSGRMASADPTDARNDVLVCFGRSDRSAQKGWPRGIKASAGTSAFCASKAAVRMFSKTVALECAAAQPSPEERLGFCILVFEASEEGLGQPLYV